MTFDEFWEKFNANYQAAVERGDYQGPPPPLAYARQKYVEIFPDKDPIFTQGPSRKEWRAKILAADPSVDTETIDAAYDKFYSDSAWDEAVRSAKRGMVRLGQFATGISAAAIDAAWAKLRVEQPRLEDSSDELLKERARLGKIAESIPKSVAAQAEWLDDPKQLANPNWWAANAPEVLASQVPVLIGAMVGGPAGAGYVGMAMEGESTYREAQEKDLNLPALRGFGQGTAAGLLNAIPFTGGRHSSLFTEIPMRMFAEGATEAAEEIPGAFLGSPVPQSGAEALSLLKQGARQGAEIFPLAGLTGGLNPSVMRRGPVKSGDAAEFTSQVDQMLAEQTAPTRENLRLPPPPPITVDSEGQAQMPGAPETAREPSGYRVTDTQDEAPAPGVRESQAPPTPRQQLFAQFEGKSAKEVSEGLKKMGLRRSKGDTNESMVDRIATAAEALTTLKSYGTWVEAEQAVSDGRISKETVLEWAKAAAPNKSAAEKLSSINSLLNLGYVKRWAAKSGFGKPDGDRGRAEILDAQPEVDPRIQRPGYRDTVIAMGEELYQALGPRVNNENAPNWAKEIAKEYNTGPSRVSSVIARAVKNPSLLTDKDQKIVSSVLDRALGRQVDTWIDAYLKANPTPPGQVLQEGKVPPYPERDAKTGQVKGRDYRGSPLDSKEDAVVRRIKNQRQKSDKLRYQVPELGWEFEVENPSRSFEQADWDALRFWQQEILIRDPGYRQAAARGAALSLNKDQRPNLPPVPPVVRQSPGDKQRGATRADIGRPDPRLLRNEFRSALRGFRNEVVKGGGGMGALIESDASRRGGPTEIIGRAASQNPPWFQRMMENPDLKMTVPQLQRAIDKALNGERLGKREARVVTALLDDITRARTTGEDFDTGRVPEVSPVEEARKKLELERALRGRGGTPATAETDLDQIFGPRSGPGGKEGGAIGFRQPKINFVFDDLKAHGMTPNLYDYNRDPGYFFEKKDVAFSKVTMSPDQYLNEAARILADQSDGKTPAQILQERSRDTKTINGIAEAMRAGEKFAAPDLNYKTGNQEGIHRALAAKRLGAATIPVGVVTSASGKNRVSPKRPIRSPGDRQRGSTSRVPPEPGEPLIPDSDYLQMGQGRIKARKFAALDGDGLRLLQNVANDWSETIDAQRRGKVPWSESDRLAVKRIADATGIPLKELLQRKVGAAANAEQLESYAMLIDAQANRVKAKAREIVEEGQDSSENLLEYRLLWEELGVLQAPFAGYIAEAGRALNKMRQITKSNLMAQQILEIEHGNLRAHAKKVAGIEDNANLATQSREEFNPTWMDKLIEYRTSMGLLSGFRTWAANILGNTSILGAEVATQIVAPAFGQQSMSQSAAHLEGMMHGVALGVRNMARAFATEQPQLEPMTKFDVPRQNAIQGPFGKFVRFLGYRSLTAQDEFFKGIAFTGRLYAVAHRKASEKAKSRQERASLAHELVERINRKVEQDLPLNPGEQEVVADAIDYARYVTFQTPLGPVGQAMLNGMNHMKATRLVVPFVRTPVNLIKRQIDYSTLGYHFANKMAKEGTIDAEQKGVYQARATVGTAMGLMAIGLAAEGLIDGLVSDDPDERALIQEASGKRPYSFRWGDRWYSYMRLDPFAMQLGIIADVYRMKNYMSEDEQKNIMAYAAMSFMENLGNKSWLGGVADFVEFANDPTRFGESYTNMMASSFVPAALAQAAGNMDPYYRQANDMLSAARKRVPWERQKLATAIGITGEPLPNAYQSYAPFASIPPRTNMVAGKMLELGMIKKRPGRKVMNVELTDVEYESFATIMGQMRFRALSQLIVDQRFINSSPFVQLEAMERTWEGVGSAARGIWMRENPQFVDRLKKTRKEAVAGSLGS